MKIHELAHKLALMDAEEKGDKEFNDVWVTSELRRPMLPEVTN